MTLDLDAWHAWHPREVAERLTGVDVPWCVAAGWALDLFRADHDPGHRPREHEDLEIAVPHDRFEQIADRFDDCDIYVIGAGDPVRYPASAAETYQTWMLDRQHRVWRLDVFREPSEGDTWISRRDDTIRIPYRDLIRRTADGIPYLRPDVVLLFKAKWARPKDEADFAGVLPLLDGDQRSWLAAALDRVHPGHPWRDRL